MVNDIVSEVLVRSRNMFFVHDKFLGTYPIYFLTKYYMKIETRFQMGKNLYLSALIFFYPLPRAR